MKYCCDKFKKLVEVKIMFYGELWFPTCCGEGYHEKSWYTYSLRMGNINEEPGVNVVKICYHRCLFCGERLKEKK